MRQDFSVVARLVPAGSDAFSFSAIDDFERDKSEDSGCAELEEHYSLQENACDISELLTLESEIPVCSEFADTTWDEELVAKVGPQSKELCEQDDNENDRDGPGDLDLPPPCLKNLRKVMECLEDIR